MDDSDDALWVYSNLPMYVRLMNCINNVTSDSEMHCGFIQTYLHTLG